MMLIKQKIAAVVSTLLIAQLAACSSDDKIPVSSLKWDACENIETLECSSIQVPMDYDQPDSVMIDIALTRKRAAESNRKGSLLFNPGGPGGSGVALVQSIAEGDTIPDAILAAYDLIGFDPRGVGGSTAVDCSDEGFGTTNPYPVDAVEVAELHADYSEIAAKCSAKYGDYLQHLGSMNVVRDMDRIRIALADAKLNFIGYSYGSRLAGLYLQEYPLTSGRIVLDGSVLPDSALRSLLFDEMQPLEANLITALSDCAVFDPNCNPEELLIQLTNRVEALVVDDSEGNDLELGLLATIIVQSAQNPGYGQFASSSIVRYLDTLDVSVLQEFIRLVNLLNGDGNDDDDDDEGDGDGDGGATVQTAVLCADDAVRPDVASLVSDLDAFNQVSDLFAELQLADSGQCAGWPEAIEPLPPIVTNTAPESLVIGGSTDAQTPLEWSRVMATEIGGVFIKGDHEGHTSVFNDESDCIDDIVEAFLLDGMSPAIVDCM